MDTDPRRPVHVLTGFLGSGKTTILRHLLADPGLAGTAVLINEIGEVGLDHRLVESVAVSPVLLENGCICCSISGDLAAALRRLLAAGLAFERVVIETTGLADPTPVLATLIADLVLRRALRPGRVLAAIDAVHVGDGFARHEVLRKQAAVADALLLTKTDLAPIGPWCEALAALNPLADMVVVIHGALDRSVLDGASGERDWLQLALAPVRHLAGSVRLTRHAPIDYTAFAVWFSLLVHRHGASLLRAKAVLWVRGSDRPVALHAVQNLIHPPRHLPDWSGARRSDLVLITDGLDAGAITRSFDAFVPPSADEFGLREEEGDLGRGVLETVRSVR